MRAEFAEKIAATLEFFIHALQHAESEFTITLDGDDARVRQFVRGVSLELDAFLEVHEIKFHLFRAAPEREICDDDVEQRGFPRAGFARNQPVLPRTLTEREILELRRASASDGYAQFARCVQTPKLVVFGCDFRKRHFHAIRIRAVLADLVEQLRREFSVGRRVEGKFCSFPIRIRQREAIALGHDADAVFT